MRDSHGFVGEVVHTFHEPGPLGFRLKPRGNNRLAPFGAYITTMTGESLTDGLKENLVVLSVSSVDAETGETIVAENLDHECYSTVLEVLQRCERPCTVVFGELLDGVSPKVTVQQRAEDNRPEIDSSFAHTARWAGDRTSLNHAAWEALEAHNYPPPKYQAIARGILWKQTLSLAKAKRERETGRGSEQGATAC